MKSGINREDIWLGISVIGELMIEYILVCY